MTQEKGATRIPLPPVWKATFDRDTHILDIPTAKQAVDDLASKGFDFDDLGHLTNAAFQEQQDLLGRRVLGLSGKMFLAKYCRGTDDRYLPADLGGKQGSSFLDQLLCDVRHMLNRAPNQVTDKQKRQVEEALTAAFLECQKQARQATEDLEQARASMRDVNNQTRKPIRSNLITLVLSLVDFFSKNRESSRSKPSPFVQAAEFLARCEIVEIRNDKSAEGKKEPHIPFTHQAVEHLYSRWSKRRSDLPPVFPRVMRTKDDLKL